MPLEPEYIGGDPETLGCRCALNVGSASGLNGEPVAPGAVPLRLLHLAPWPSLQVRLRERRVNDAIGRALAHQRREVFALQVENAGSTVQQTTARRLHVCSQR